MKISMTLGACSILGLAACGGAVHDRRVDVTLAQ
jgi:hypothetical protein